MAAQAATPPLGATLSVDIGERTGPRGVRVWARVRWVDPGTGQRVSRKKYHPTREAAEQWVDQIQRAAQTGIDTGQTLAAYVGYIGDRWARGIDPTSTYDPYSAGLRRRVLPTLGHLPVAMISAGLVDRAIDEWEQLHSRSTVKNSVAALVLVMDEAVRDGLLVRSPARDRLEGGPWVAPPSRRSIRARARSGVARRRHPGAPGDA